MANQYTKNLYNQESRVKQVWELPLLGEGIHLILTSTCLSQAPGIQGL